MTHGGLALKGGVLFVGRHAGRARVAPYDLDGRRLGPGFTFGGRGADAGRGRAAISGMAVDEDRRLWIADQSSRCLRLFTAFGRALGEVGRTGARDALESSAEPRGIDQPGAPDQVRATAGAGGADLGRPVDVAVRGADVDQEVIVASGGRQRHALRVLPVEPEARGARRPISMRPLGDPRGRFLDLTAVACRGDEIWVCEAGALGDAGGGPAGRVQVFRSGEFHFSFGLGAELDRGPATASDTGGSRRVGRAQGLALLADGRCLVAIGGEEHSALHLLDGGGRLLALVALAGKDEGCVWEPSRLVVETVETARGDLDERRTRVAVMDCDGDRVQVFNLEGSCYGSFLDLP